MSQVVSFAEESCWDKEQFRQIRKRVVFRVYSVGRNLGEPFTGEFEADYSLWYDQEDDELIGFLSEVNPEVVWEHMVFHKKLDKSGIDVYETVNDRLVARIEVRRTEFGLSRSFEENLGENVIRFTDIPGIIARLREEEESRRTSRRKKRSKIRDIRREEDSSE